MRKVVGICVGALVAVVQEGCVAPWIPEPIAVRMIGVYNMNSDNKRGDLPELLTKISGNKDDVMTKFLIGRSEPQFFEGDLEIDYDKFYDAYKLGGFNPTQDCLDLIGMFFINRPIWFSATGQDIKVARDCVLTGFDKLNQMPEAGDHGLIVAKGLSIVGEAVFGPKTELWVRLPDQVKEVDTKALADRLRNPVIVELIEEAQSRFAIPMLEDYRDLLSGMYLMQRVGEPNWMVHLSDFLDFYGTSPSTIPLWRALSQPGVRLSLLRPEQRATSDSLISLKKKRVQLLSATWDSWKNSVGSFLQRLYRSNAAVVEECTGPVNNDSELRRLFENAPAMYSCVIDLVLARSTMIPRDSSFPSSVTALLHMIKVAHDSLALQ
jgi:hypothetical protein